MKYYVFKKLTDEKFRRLIGVNPATFDKMIVILNEAGKEKKH